jgi:hypothetical protein
VRARSSLLSLLNAPAPGFSPAQIDPASAIALSFTITVKCTRQKHWSHASSLLREPLLHGSNVLVKHYGQVMLLCVQGRLVQVAQLGLRVDWQALRNVRQVRADVDFWRVQVLGIRPCPPVPSAPSISSCSRSHSQRPCPVFPSHQAHTHHHGMPSQPSLTFPLQAPDRALLLVEQAHYEPHQEPRVLWQGPPRHAPPQARGD